jgi:hypothetical protein
MEILRNEMKVKVTITVVWHAREVKEETGQVASPPVKRNIRATPVMESEPKEVA